MQLQTSAKSRLNPRTVVQGAECGALYSTVRSCQTHRVVLDALYP